MAMASAAVMTPMPTVRPSQMRFSESSVSYWSMRFGEVIDELLHVLGEAFVGVVRHPADAPRVTGETRAELLLENLQNLLALAQRVQQHGEGADVERVRREPEQVRRDAVQLRQDRRGCSARAAGLRGPIICSTVSTQTSPFETAAM